MQAQPLAGGGPAQDVEVHLGPPADPVDAQVGQHLPEGLLQGLELDPVVRLGQAGEELVRVDQLDRPGILEKSMDRGASNPHAEWTEQRRAN